MQGSGLKTRLFLVVLFLVLLVIAAAGWVVRPFTAMARWARPRRSAEAALFTEGERLDAASAPSAIDWSGAQAGCAPSASRASWPRRLPSRTHAAD
jgi:hypothetical protein